MTKQDKKAKAVQPEAVTKVRTGIPVHGVGGILLATVCASMAFNIFLIVQGTDSRLNELMQIPQVLFILAFGLYKAWK